MTDLRLTSRDIERFWSKVDKSPGQGPRGECWQWTAGTAPFGYGAFWLPDPPRMVRAHRVAWTLAHGPIPTSLYVLHHCDNPPCVRCLFLGTSTDNIADMDAKGRRVTGFRPTGESHHNARLTVEQVREIRSRSHPTIRGLAREFDVDRGTIRHVLQRLTWKEVD